MCNRCVVIICDVIVHTILVRRSSPFTRERAETQTKLKGIENCSALLGMFVGDLTDVVFDNDFLFQSNIDF